MCFRYLRLFQVFLLGLTLSSVGASDCKHKLDVVVVLDGSGSINAGDFVKLKSAAIQLAQDLNLGSNGQRFGAVVFSSSVTDIIPLSSNVVSLKSKISGLQQPKGGTRTYLGIDSMTQMLQSHGRRGSKKVGIVITDGQSSTSVTITAAKKAKKAGITMFSVGVGNNLNMVELNGIASSSSNVLRLKNFDALKKKFKSLIKKICIVNGGWSRWSTPSHGSCSKSCGGGTRIVTKSRTCTNPSPSPGGRQCVGSRTQTYSQSCNTHHCVVDGVWSGWSVPTFGSCSKSCGGGTHSVTKTRTCTNPSPKWGGKQCEGSSTQISSQSCNTQHCPVDGVWSGWSGPTFGSCSKSCGGGTQSVTKTRTCTNPSPKWGGKQCVGSSTQTSSQSCNTQHCPVHGGWSSWTTKSRSSCSATCGGGAITVRQSRTCTNPPPQHGGNNCSGSETNVYTVACNTFACPSCDGCLYDNGVGYVPHPTDCRFYVQCIGWGAAYHIRQCPPGLYWKQDNLICARPSAVNCTTTATAAPPVQDGDTAPPPPPPRPVSTCEMKAVPGKTSLYSVHAEGHGWVERSCGSGTIFNAASCSCVPGGSQTRQGCKDELYLPLNTDLKDHSKHKMYIENHGVKITKGSQAAFAHNGVLRIHRFSNMDFGKTLHISFLLHKGQKKSKDQVIVTNAECTRTGSIYIIQKSSAVEFRVLNQKGVFATVTVPQTKMTSSVTLTVHKGVMTGSVNGVNKKVPFKGRIARVQCGLQIGRGTGYDNFSGLLEKFKLSLCKP